MAEKISQEEIHRNAKRPRPHAKLHEPVAKATISRRAKEIMNVAGVIVEVLQPRSTRSTATSAVKVAGAPNDEIFENRKIENFVSF